MKRILSIVLSLSVVLSMSGIFSYADSNAADESSLDKMAEDVVVVFNSDESEEIADMTESKAEEFLDMDPAVEVEKIEEIGTYEEDDADVNMTAAVLSSDKMSVSEIIDEAEKSDAVKYAVPNVKLQLMTATDDTYADKLWGIDRTEASDIWEQSDEENDYTGTDKVVAIVDTGVDYTHTDLSSNMWVNPYQAKLKGKYGYDFVNNDKDPMDDHGHGTHCAGTIGAAGNNGEGVVGMCQNVKIMALKVLDSEGSGDLDSILSAYAYISKAQDLGVDVVAVNNSWGFELTQDEAAFYYEQEELDALEAVFTEAMNTVGAKGALSVCAAGNSGADMGDIYEIPAGCDCEYMISVAALDQDGSQAYYSNYSSEKVDIAAPGTDILSTVCYEGLDVNLLSEEQKEIAVNHEEGYEESTDLSKVMYFDGDNKKGIEAASCETCVCTVTDEKQASGEKSLKLEVTDAEEDEYYAFAIPMDLCGQETPYVQFKTLSSSSHESEAAYVYFGEGSGKLTLSRITNSNIIDYTAAQGEVVKWDNIRGQLEGDGSEDEYFLVIVAPVSDGTFEVCLDDFVMTNTPTEEIEAMKTKYDTYSGTSMATPHVTGAAALVENYISKSLGADLDKEDRAVAIKTILMGNAKDTEAQVKSGELNLEGIKTSPVISKVEATAGSLVITGRNFIEGTKVTVNGKEYADVEVSEDGTSVTVPADYRNYQLEIAVENELGKTTKKKLIVSNKTDYVKQEADFSEFGEIPEGSVMFSDGYDPYIMFTEDNTVNIAKYEYGMVGLVNTCEDVIRSDEDIQYVLASEPVVADGKVYVLLAGIEDESYMEASDLIFSINSSYACEYRLVSMSLDEDDMGLFEAIELPAAYDNIDGEALGAYNGNIYLLGGYDYAKESTSTLVYKYTVSTGKWSKPSAAQLPAGRYGGSAVQSGSRLFYAMGASETGKMPKVLKFNGSGWIESTKQLDSSDCEAISVGESELNYYNGDVCLVSGGVVLTGVFVNGYGDTVNYVSAKYSASKYNYKQKLGESVSATAAGKYIYLLDGNEIYRGTFTSGLVKATGTFSHGKVLNIGKSYLPGTKVKYTAKPYKGYKKSTFYVNGTKVSGTVKTVRLTGNIKIKATFKKK